MRKQKTLVPSEAGKDWRADKARGHVAHYDPETEEFDGPENAFVFFGQPYQGDPWRNHITDTITGKPAACQPYVDKTKVSTQLGGVPVEWVDFDAATGCNVYRRVEVKA